jgi:hypothetical protein
MSAVSCGGAVRKKLEVWMLWFWWLACAGGATSSCEELCSILVVECKYSAFPSKDSCLEGCAYNEEEGTDIEGQLACVQEASCDTFEILECEHQSNP